MLLLETTTAETSCSSGAPWKANIRLPDEPCGEAYHKDEVILLNAELPF